MIIVQHSDKSLMAVSEVLSLAADGIKVLQIDAQRYQDRIGRLEQQLRNETKRRQMIEDQFLQQSRSLGFTKSNVLEMSRTGDSSILRDENNSIMTILSSNSAIQEELKRLSGKLNLIVNGGTQNASLLNSQSLSPTRDTQNELFKPFRAFLAVLKDL